MKNMPAKSIIRKGPERRKKQQHGFKIGHFMQIKPVGLLSEQEIQSAKLRGVSADTFYRRKTLQEYPDETTSIKYTHSRDTRKIPHKYPKNS
jgi:hypothetical protein